MGEKLKSPISGEDSNRTSTGQQDTQDVISVDQVSVGNGINGLDPNSEEYKAMEKKLVRKIDLHLMPIMILLYVCNYLG